MSVEAINEKRLRRIRELRAVQGGSFREQQERGKELWKLQREMAEQFGRLRGWRLDLDKPFGPKTLGRRARRLCFTNGVEWEWPREIDHPFHYRLIHGGP